MTGLIIAMIDEKGGAGKTTLAVNTAAALARHGLSVMLVDCDPQPLAADWALERAENERTPVVPCRQLISDDQSEVTKTLVDAANDHDVVIVDTEGRAGRMQHRVMLIADLILSPLQPNMADMKSLIKLDQMISAADLQRQRLTPKKASLTRIGIIYRISSNHRKRIRVEKFARTFWSQFPAFQLMDAMLSDKTAFEDSHAGGRSVYDSRDKKTKAEMDRFILELIETLQGN